MSWATPYIEKLKAGTTVHFKARGHSMTGRISNGQRVTVTPAFPGLVKVDDIVLCRVKGRDYLHLIKSIRHVGNEAEYLIANNRGHENGWTQGAKIFGKVTEIGE